MQLSSSTLALPRAVCSSPSDILLIFALGKTGTVIEFLTVLDRMHMPPLQDPSPKSHPISWNPHCGPRLANIQLPGSEELSSFLNSDGDNEGCNSMVVFGQDETR